MNRVEVEKSLKRFLKRKVSYSFGLLIAFMISGEVYAVTETVSAKEKETAAKIEETQETEELEDLITYLKTLNDKTALQKSEDKSRQFFFSLWLEKRKAKKYADNGFKGSLDVDLGPEIPDIEIPDIIKPINPEIEEPGGAIPENENGFIDKAPEFNFGKGETNLGKLPGEITMNVTPHTPPVTNINKDDFNILDTSKVSDPKTELGSSLTGIGASPSVPEVSLEIKKPNLNYAVSVPVFKAPTAPRYIPKDIEPPASNAVPAVKISASGFNQGAQTTVFTNLGVGEMAGTITQDPNNNENCLTDPNGKWPEWVKFGRQESKTPVVVENFSKYHGHDFDVYFNGNQIYYRGASDNSHFMVGIGKGYIEHKWGFNKNDKNIEGYGLRQAFAENPKIAAFINDLVDDDATLTGKYNIQYEGGRGVSATDDYIRIFLSSNPAGIVNEIYRGENKETVKVTDFQGELNLSTTANKGGSTNSNEVGGNLIGLEHQTWDKYEQVSENRSENFKKSYSVLLNSGTINLGMGRPNSNGEQDKIEKMENSKNMIGIMIDLEQSSGLDYKKQNNKTINGGTINIYGQNSIGISFEEYRNAENMKSGYFLLRDDAYVGKINVEGKNNYGVKLGNIFKDQESNNYRADFSTYFDKTKLIGTVEAGKITVNNDDGKKIEINYAPSLIDVKGTQNTGIYVAKSLSSNAIDYEGGYKNGNSIEGTNGKNPYKDKNMTKDELEAWLKLGKVNPIANFDKIQIKVNGENNIGFVRGRDYSDNNKNDMVIDNKNITGLSFADDAKNSVLVRSEHYGITLHKDRELDVSSKAKESKAGEKDYYNVVMQGTAQTWQDGSNQKNSAGTVTNEGTIKGTTNNMIALMSSGELTEGVSNWQNNDNREKAKAVNKGKIELTGNKNIGMAVIGKNEGTLEGGTITLNGEKAIGIYNKGYFEAKKGDKDSSNTITATGKDTIAVYNEGNNNTANNGKEGSMKLSDTAVNISGGSTGIYSKGGTTEFGSNVTITETGGSSGAGIYSEKGTFKGDITIKDTKAGVIADKGTTNIQSGNLTYEGEGYALYVKNNGDSQTNGKIVFGSTTTKDVTDKKLTLKGKEKDGKAVGNAYGVNIDVTRTNGDKAVDFNGATIDIQSDNVIVFNVLNKEEDKGKITVESSKYNENGSENFEKFVGKYTINGNDKGYKIAAIDGGTVNLDDKSKNMDFLKKYNFQRSHVNVSQDIERKLSTTDADKYFNGEIIGIGQSSSENIKKDGTTGDKQREETKITIKDGATVTADRTDGSNKASIGAYIDYGVISLENGKLVVENDGAGTKDVNVINNNGIGVYTKNGSKISTDKESSITVNGEKGTGIYAEATKKDENKGGKNKFGGDVTVFDISNKGTITVGKEGTGIFADNGESEESKKASVSNEGTITVGEKGKGIYVVNSEVKNIGTISLGNKGVGVYIGEKSKVSSADINNATFKSNKNGSDGAEGTGIYFAKSAENQDINFNIDISDISKGRAVVSTGRNITLKEGKTITASGNGGKGIRISEATATNKGNIVIKETAESNNERGTGLFAGEKNGVLNNEGTITVKGNKGIGIYAENNGTSKAGDKTEKTGNRIDKIGTINLGADGAIGVAAKNTDVTLNSSDNISFAVTENNGTSTAKNAVNSIGIYAEGGKVINNKTDLTVTGNGDLKDKKNTGIYLANGASYEEKGSIKVENGAVGIYADKGVTSLKNLKITSDSKGVQTVGVVLNGEAKDGSKEKKEVSGSITLTNSDNDNIKGVNVGVYASNSSVKIAKGETLEFKHDGSNGTGIYLDKSSLEGEGTIKITGTPKTKDNETYNSIGIYYAGNSSSAEHKVTLEIDKSSTIGAFASSNSSFVRGADIKIGNGNNAVENVTGMAVADNGKAENKGTITLGNVKKGTGMAALGGTEADKTATLTNSGKISISDKAVNGTGVFLTGNSEFNGSSGTIEISGKDGIGIFAQGEKAKISSVGSFDMAEGNTAVYSEGADISADINLNTNGKNKGTTALAVKSDNNKTTTVGGTADKKMKITLAEKSTGIYGLDSGVKIENVSIDATAHNKDEKDALSYGIYLEEDNGKTYSINNTDINIVKGAGIVLSSKENAKTNLDLTGSSIKADSYSEQDGKETGIGIYAEKGSKLTLKGGNTLDVSYGTGVYSDGGEVSIGEEKEDTINLQGYSVGVYSKGGKVTLGEHTNLTFNKIENTKEDGSIVKGAGVYAVDKGEITSSANIVGTGNLEEFTALSGKESTITNSGDITLTGEAVSGITAQGGSITNRGNITVTDNKLADGKAMSAGIYSEGASVDNQGTVTVKGGAAGVIYKGSSDSAVVKTGAVNIEGEKNIGVSLSGSAKEVTIGAITGKGTNNSGLHMNEFTGDIKEVKDITLGEKALAVHAENNKDKGAVIKSLGKVTTGNNGMGVAVTKNGKLTIEGDFNVTTGDNGTGVYVGEGSELKVSSLKGVKVGTDGALAHINKGTLTLETSAEEITINNHVGVVLEDGGDVKLENGSLKNMTVTGGGTGLVIKGSASNRPTIFGTDSKITLGSGTKDKYSTGIYYQGAQNIGDINKIKVDYQDKAQYAIGNVFDRTYGTMENSEITMGNTVTNSIGVLVKRNQDESGNMTFKASGDKDLVNVNGDSNIGILAQDSEIITEGNIVTGTDTSSEKSAGVYLIGKDSSIAHSYKGKGDITVGSNSDGIYAKNYDVTQEGNIKITGSSGVGIAGVVTDGYKGSSSITHTGNIEISGSAEKATGIYGKGTGISSKGDMNISGKSNIGIAGIAGGDISFEGKANINGENSIGIYKDTEKSEAVEHTEVKVGKGEWTVGEKAIGIGVKSDKKDDIKVENSSNMTLGQGAIGIYSSGKNTVINSGNINVGAGIKGEGEEKDTPSIGIYMANGFGGAYAIGENRGTITADENGAVGVQAVGYTQITNKAGAKIVVSGNGTGMAATLGGRVVNEGDITVTGMGAGMLADGVSSAGGVSTAVNNGNITLNADTYSSNNKALLGMGAYNGGKVINGVSGKITVNQGTGMYFDEKSSFENKGEIIVNNGVGIMGTGITTNNGGKITVNGGMGTFDPAGNSSQSGSVLVDSINKVVEVNDNFINTNGGVLESNLDIKLNNPTVDAATGGFGFIGENITGGFRFNNKFAFEGNGYRYEIKDLADRDLSGLKADAGHLFNAQIDGADGNDYIIEKERYENITAGNQFDIRDNAVDNILAQGGPDAEIIRDLGGYLNSIKNLDYFQQETERALGELGGNIYANVQSRMQDINRSFDNSFEEMLNSRNLSHVTDKYSMIYTNGEYENSNKNLVGYDYNIIGLNYMREFEDFALKRKYGIDFGFAGSKFRFDDSGSKEDVYSLRAGAHHVKWFENGISLISKAEVGYNRHNTDRKVNLGYAVYDTDAEFNSYHAALDNKARFALINTEDTKAGIYTGLNLEYGRFDDIKEHDILDLKVKSGDYMSSKVFAGADAEKIHHLSNNWALKFKGDAQYSYDLGHNYKENKASIGGSQYYSLMSEVETKGAVTGKIGVAFEKLDHMGVTLEGEYIKDFARDEAYWRAGLRFNYKFNVEDIASSLKNSTGFLKNHFEFDKDTLNEEGKRVIKEASDIINEKDIKGTVVIEGHTDSTGSETYNQLLSEKRAKAIENEFRTNIKNSENINYQSKGYGELKPAADNKTAEGRAENRRTELKFKQN